MPKVSILIPVYNRKKYIADCIESAINQTYKNYEIIIVDNASNDGTWEICKNYSLNNPQIHAYRNEINIGPVLNWIECVKKAKGEYIKILWSDDLMHSDFLNKVLPFIENPEIGFVYSVAKIFRNHPDDECLVMGSVNKTGVYSCDEYINGIMLNKSYPGSPGCAIFKTIDVKENLVINIPNRINSNFAKHAIGNDLLLYLLTANKYDKYAVINEPLSYFRSHDESITTSAPIGKVALHYDIVKGYYAECFLKNIPIRKKFNAELLIHLILYYGNTYGLRKISDFYPKKAVRISDIDYLYLLNKVICFGNNKIIKYLFKR
ncbi:MAG: glycosyltransferase family 2 protein [Deltaproteobacteria bacterium]|jgi:glycosyltransferase involved in cell wall biosynthesis|nr:glycosyltransferase family 2 protein [Deltaproteobacteria bacterium]